MRVQQRYGQTSAAAEAPANCKLHAHRAHPQHAARMQPAPSAPANVFCYPTKRGLFKNRPRLREALHDAESEPCEPAARPRLMSHQVPRQGAKAPSAPAIVFTHPPQRGLPLYLTVPVFPRVQQMRAQQMRPSSTTVLLRPRSPAPAPLSNREASGAVIGRHTSAARRAAPGTGAR